MKILGIDPGTIITGFGVIQTNGSKITTIDYGCVRPPASLKLTDRYLIIFNAIEELINKYSPDALIVETQFVNKNPMSALKLGQARGMAIIAAKRKQIPVYEVSPKKAKLAVVGTGNASKEQVQKMVEALLGISNVPTDAADALALAISHVNSINQLFSTAVEI